MKPFAIVNLFNKIWNSFLKLPKKYHLKYVYFREPSPEPKSAKFAIGIDLKTNLTI